MGGNLEHGWISVRIELHGRLCPMLLFVFAAGAPLATVIRRVCEGTVKALVVTSPTFYGDNVTDKGAC